MSGVRGERAVGGEELGRGVSQGGGRAADDEVGVDLGEALDGEMAVAGGDRGRGRMHRNFERRNYLRSN
nr:unnamed protein product [Digitaria exilis]